MTRLYDIVTFDCYGTLIDWDRGIVDAFADAVAAHGGNLDERRALETYERVEPIVEAEGYRSYREVLTESVRRVARELGWALPESRAGFRLGILSNVDDDLLAGTRRQFRVDFDLIVTAQQVRSYKPADGHFLEARQRIGGKRWLHAAQSHFHDVVPCQRLRISVAWVNRKGLVVPGTQKAERELRTLTELAHWLEEDDNDG